MHKTTYKKRLDELFISKQEQKSRNKNKVGLPPNKCYRLTPLARYDDFNDAHIKDKNKQTTHTKKICQKQNSL